MNPSKKPELLGQFFFCGELGGPRHASAVKLPSLEQLQQQLDEQLQEANRRGEPAKGGKAFKAPAFHLPQLPQLPQPARARRPERPQQLVRSASADGKLPVLGAREQRPSPAREQLRRQKSHQQLHRQPERRQQQQQQARDRPEKQQHVQKQPRAQKQQNQQHVHKQHAQAQQQQQQHHSPPPRAREHRAGEIPPKPGRAPVSVGKEHGRASKQKLPSQPRSVQKTSGQGEQEKPVVKNNGAVALREEARVLCKEKERGLQEVGGNQLQPEAESEPRQDNAADEGVSPHGSRSARSDQKPGSGCRGGKKDDESGNAVDSGEHAETCADGSPDDAEQDSVAGKVTESKGKESDEGAKDDSEEHDAASKGLAHVQLTGNSSQEHARSGADGKTGDQAASDAATEAEAKGSYGSPAQSHTPRDSETGGQRNEVTAPASSRSSRCSRSSQSSRSRRSSRSSQSRRSSRSRPSSRSSRFSRSSRSSRQPSRSRSTSSRGGQDVEVAGSDVHEDVAGSDVHQDVEAKDEKDSLNSDGRDAAYVAQEVAASVLRTATTSELSEICHVDAAASRSAEVILQEEGCRADGENDCIEAHVHSLEAGIEETKASGIEEGSTTIDDGQVANEAEESEAGESGGQRAEQCQEADAEDTYEDDYDDYDSESFEEETSPAQDEVSYATASVVDASEPPSLPVSAPVSARSEGSMPSSISI
eukprot:gb/GFBE01031404.1/.p1 GENE.gb/GFBE01031404.1/~~gb/GFBE01031404.1/.p1  ORF type:complete len:705 (+),score=133.66 gb/GFBE01031404.1/:1-2115(+)